MKYQINLLTEKQETLLNRVVYFSLNYLKIILVITQIVVIFVFFYKFKVDQELIDLKEAVDQKKEIIVISKSLLKEATVTEYKINQIKPIFKNQTAFFSQFNYLLSIFPEPLFLTKLKIGEKQTTLDGYSQDAKVIKQFDNQLQKDKKFKEVNLPTIKKTEIGYEFSLVLKQFKD